jgi:NADH:ubiquinone oxidoreductase subunit 3 (subunit A)
MTLTPKEYLKVILLFLPYFSNVTLQHDISSKKVCIKPPKIDLGVPTNMQFATFWSTPCVISIKEFIDVISFLLTFIYSTIFVFSKFVPSVNFFLSMFFKNCLTIISIFQGSGALYVPSWKHFYYMTVSMYSDWLIDEFDGPLEDLFSSDSLYLNEYLSIFIYFMVTILLSYVILSFSYILAVQKPETEKMSVYECGFEPYEDARQKFDVHFYLLAILFILFDIEAMFLIPWCVSLPFINYVGYLIMMEFILELCLGFLYIWYLGGLDW